MTSAANVTVVATSRVRLPSGDACSATAERSCDERRRITSPAVWSGRRWGRGRNVKIRCLTSYSSAIITIQLLDGPGSGPNLSPMPNRLNAETAPSVEDRALVFKAIGDPTRVRIIELLRAQTEEITGTEIAGCVGVSLALLCHHSSVLVEAGLVTKRKEGQTSYWMLNRDALAAALGSLAEPSAIAG
ncbi:MAG: metalloregulator ArsR/SmtB family transcription factor [bacterium]